MVGLARGKGGWAEVTVTADGEIHLLLWVQAGTL